MKPDATDAKIVEALMDDGRASFRQIALRTSLTTPTVSARIARMVKGGLIKKFIPVLDQGLAHPGESAFVTLRARAADTNRVAKKLSAMEEVVGIYVTTGENNIALRIHCQDAKRLQGLLTVDLPKLPGAEVVSSQLIVDTVKDEQPALMSDEIMLKLSCDYCNGEVSSNRPYNIQVGSTRHYFCCRTCRREFLKRYGPRIGRLDFAQKTT